MIIMQKKPNEIIGIIAAACLMYAVSAGLRSVYGIMLGTISEETQISYGTVSFAIAIGQLAFGVAQPIFGVVSLKKSNSFVLIIGSIMMAVGLATIPFCKIPWMLILFFGIILPIGTGAVSFGMIMGAITPKLGDAKAATASGIINASSGVGSVVFSPLIHGTFSLVGFKTTMFGFAALAVLLIPVSIVVSGKKEEGSNEREIKENSSASIEINSIMKQAFSNGSYLFLMVGFFTCGFHMAIIETHLYAQIVSIGISEFIAAIALSLYGFASIVGSLFSGFLCSRIRMKYVLGTLYGIRAITVSTFLLMPKTITVILVFIVLIGLTGAATVTPTSGLVGKLFGSRNIATLFGIVFLSHQCGSFFSAWLGGKCVEITGNYILIWVVAVVLSIIAMLVSYKINEVDK